MAGNVWEWTNDWFDANYYATDPTTNPAGPWSGDFKIIRGGGWNSANDKVRSANRFAIEPALSFKDVGFRCVANDWAEAPNALHPGRIARTPGGRRPRARRMVPDSTSQNCGLSTMAIPSPSAARGHDRLWDSGTEQFWCNLCCRDGRQPNDLHVQRRLSAVHWLRAGQPPPRSRSPGVQGHCPHGGFGRTPAFRMPHTVHPSSLQERTSAAAQVPPRWKSPTGRTPFADQHPVRQGWYRPWFLRISSPERFR